MCGCVSGVGQGVCVLGRAGACVWGRVEAIIIDIDNVSSIVMQNVSNELLTYTLDGVGATYFNLGISLIPSILYKLMQLKNVYSETFSKFYSNLIFI